MSDGRRIARNDVPIRLRELFGRRGLVPRLMTALDRGHSSVEDIVAGRNVPVEVIWIVEILSNTPRRYWPERWIAACGEDADPVRALQWTDAKLEPARAVLLQGGSYREAAIAVGATAGVVRNLAFEGRLPRPTRTSRRKARGAVNGERARQRYLAIQQMIDADGLTPSQLALRLGVSRQRVWVMQKRGQVVFTKS